MMVLLIIQLKFVNDGQKKIRVLNLLIKRMVDCQMLEIVE